MEKQYLEEQAQKGFSSYDIAKTTGKSQTTIRYWLKKFGVVTNGRKKLRRQGQYVVCTTCGRSYSYDRSKGHSFTQCNSCKTNLKRFELKKKCVEYKGGSCCRCGYNRCLGALEFHHKKEEEKDFSISGGHSRSWSAITAELDKCDLLCANCHREAHEAMS